MKKETVYFNFKELSKPMGEASVFNYVGWSGLHVAKFFIPKGKKITNSLIDESHPDLYNKEKIFVTTEGNIELKSEEFDLLFNEFDAIDFIGEQNYYFNSLKDTSIFMISAKDSKVCDGKSIHFNFKKDIDARNLWGGQIISRPYEGKELTLVLFELKSGFKFEDKGHANEQITWLTNGEMAFYSNGNRKTLTADIGVSIGQNHVHGGVSKGALGFDAFFPKRIEEKYKKDLNK